MSPVERLLAIEEITRLKARYARYLDSHDWPALRSIMTDDAVFGSELTPEDSARRASGGAGGYWSIPHTVGADVIIEWFAKAMAEISSVHMVFQPEIDILSATEAKAIWAVADIIRRPQRVVKGYGYYRDVYVRQDGVWKLHRWELFRKSVEYQDFMAIGEGIV